MTTRQDIEEWFQRGQEQGSDYMIVVCDTFDWEDYPVYCKAAQFEAEKAAHNGVNMQKIMETYDLRKNKGKQIIKPRSFV